MICTKPRNGACWAMYSPPSESIAAARHSAECTAPRANTMPSPPSRAIGPRIQNVTASPVEITSVMTPPPREEVRRRALLHLLPHRLVGQVLPGQGRTLDVVVLLVLAQPHRVRRLLHAG